MLNESAKGLMGSRGHRIVENNYLQKQKIVAKALMDFHNLADSSAASAALAAQIHKV